LPYESGYGYSSSNQNPYLISAALLRVACGHCAARPLVCAVNRVVSDTYLRLPANGPQGPAGGREWSISLVWSRPFNELMSKSHREPPENSTCRTINFALTAIALAVSPFASTALGGSTRLDRVLFCPGFDKRRDCLPTYRCCLHTLKLSEIVIELMVWSEEFTTVT
jgi:hypothetical protein